MMTTHMPSDFNRSFGHPARAVILPVGDGVGFVP